MTKIQLRRGSTVQWSTANPVLALGELGLDNTLGDIKIGDGVTTWNSLPLYSTGLRPDNGGKPVGKGELVLNLGDSGATMNGTVDDTAKIQAFVTAAPQGATIIMPPYRTVTLSDKITLSKAVNIHNWNVKMGANNKAFEVVAHNVTIQECTLTGVGIAAGYVVNNRAINVVGTSGTPLQNVVILQNWITGINDTAINTLWTRDGKILDNYIQNFVYAGILVSSATDVDIMGNTVKDATQGSTGNSYGIAVTDNINTIAGRSNRVKVHNNTIMNVPDWEGIDTHGGAFISIIGNTLIGCRRAIQCLVGNEPTRLLAPQYCTIIGNTIDGTGSNGATTGITLYGKTDSSMLAHGIVTSNNLYNCTTPLQIGYTDPTLTMVRNNMGAVEVDTSETDTGWQPITSGMLAVGWQSNSTYPARYRIIKRGGRTEVRLDGALSRTTGWTLNLFTLPAEAQPGYAKLIGITTTTANTPEIGTLDIHPTSGMVRFVFTSSTTGNLSITSSFTL